MRCLRSFCSTLLLAVLAALLAGCGPRETPVATGDRTQTLHRSLNYEPAELDPHLATGLAEAKILAALYEGLVTVNPDGGEPLPAGATGWDISADRLTWTFHLRPDAHWSNGDLVTASDYIASWRRILTPTLAADNAPWFYVIAGAEAFHKGVGDFAEVGLAAPDAHTLVVRLEHPVPYFLSLLTHFAWRPVHLVSIAAQGDPTRRGNAWARPEHIVTNGPFTLTTWRPGQQVVVTRNAKYWDAANVHLAAIHFHFFDNRDAEERAFRAGQLHVTDALPFGKVEAYRRDQAALLRQDATLGTYFYRLNTLRAPLSDVRIRRALALAVDRAALVERVLRGGQMIARSFTPPGLAGYTPPTGPGTDFDKARRLLTEAGFPGGAGLPPIELLIDASQNHRAVAEMIQETWRRELGVQLQLVQQDAKSIFAARRTGDFQLVRSDWVGDFADPLTFLGVWTSDSGNNYTGWANPAYDNLLRRAALTAEPAERLSLLREAETLLLAEAPFIALNHTTHLYLAQPSVKGWRPTPLEEVDYRHVRLEP